MKPSTLPTAARAAGLVLAVLTAIAGYNTAVVVEYTLDREGQRTGLVVAIVVSAVVTGCLGWAAWRLWRRGSGESGT